LANTERHLDVSKGHSQRANDKTDELKQLNKSIFRPVIAFNKDAKRAAQEAKLQARYEEEREEREKAMMDIRDTQNRIGRAATYGREGDDELIGGGGSGRFPTSGQLSARKEQRKRYQFEANASDDEIEDELDGNLDEISDMTKRLKALGMTMGDELDKQNSRIKRIDEKTVGLDDRIFQNTERVSQPLKSPIFPPHFFPCSSRRSSKVSVLSNDSIYPTCYNPPRNPTYQLHIVALPLFPGFIHFTDTIHLLTSHWELICRVKYRNSFFTGCSTYAKGIPFRGYLMQKHDPVIAEYGSILALYIEPATIYVLDSLPQQKPQPK